MASKRPDTPLDNNITVKDNSKKTETATESITEDKILFWCSECGQKYRLPRNLSGKTGVCFKCKNYLFIPSKSQEAPALPKAIFFACKHCGSKQRRSRKFIGTMAKCSECGEKNIVPKKSKISSLPKDGDVPEERILFWCHYCGQKYRLPEHLAGKKGNCDRCHNDFVIPAKTQTKPTLKKTVVFPCKCCGQKQWQAIECTGKEIECNKCSEKNIVPDKSTIIPLTQPESTKSDRILFWCHHCGQKYRLPRDLAGKKANCDKCKNDFIIPAESQVKPERRETIIFPCEHCGQKIRKPKELIGAAIKCSECGKSNIVPEKSKKSLLEIVAPKKALAPFISAEATRMNLQIPQQITKPKISPAKQTPEEINLNFKKKITSLAAQKTEGEPSKPAPATDTEKVEEQILFWCSYCKQKYRLPHNLAGKKSICNHCHNDLLIPSISQTEPQQKDTIIFPCKHCGKKLWKPLEFIGKEVVCHQCGKENTVPEKSSFKKIVPPQSSEKTKEEPQATERKILFWCGYCKQKYRLPDKLAGKKSTCDICKNELFIPSISQTKPQLKDAIIFHCKHCNKKLWKPLELADKEVTCHECGKENTVPKTSSFKKPAPIKLQNAFIATDSNQKSMLIVGRPTVSREKTANKFRFKTTHDTEPTEEGRLRTREDYIGPKIVITEDPPTIHKINNFFQRKAEKYFIFAIFVLVLEYLINTYSEGRRPSKTFVVFSAFTTSLIILLLAYNYITYKPADKTSKCRYNIMCTNPKCNHNEIRRFEDITQGKCSKCSSRVGLAYRCKSCNKSFVYDEVQSKKELKAKNIREAKRKAKWYGEKVTIKNTLLSNRIVKKCPYCRSTNVYYVTVKQAEKEAEQKAIEKEFQEADQKAAAATKKKSRKKSRKKKK